MAYSEDIEINVRIIGRDEVSPTLEGVQHQLESISSSVTVFGEATEDMVIPVKIGKEEIGDTGKRVREALSPLRIMSRDVWTLAYAFRRLNYATGLNSEAVKGLVNVLVALGAVMRVLAVIQSVTTLLESQKLTLYAVTAATWLYNKALAVMHALSGPTGWAILGGAMVASAVAVAWMASQRSMQYGGTVPETGMYMLHKGETVTPEGTEYTNIVINVSTGPISSEMDVENLLDVMALRMAQERRRRGG